MTPTHNAPYPRLPHPILPSPQRTTPLPDAPGQICLCVLARITGPHSRWVRLHPTGACATQLRRLGFTDNLQAIWSALATTGQVNLHPTLPFHYARLTRLGRAQAKHLSPPIFVAAPPHYQTILRELYPLAFATDAHPDNASAWSEIRTRYPLQWVVLEVIQSHIEGPFLLPDQLKLWGSFATYGDALFYVQSLPPAPTLFLAHTIVSSLVLEHPTQPP